MVHEPVSPRMRPERVAEKPIGDAPSHADMVRLPGGTFRMGSDRHYPEEAPVHRVMVSPFRIDRTPVTNRQFRRFVEATGHVTLAEIAPDPKDYPGALPHMLKPGSLVFAPPRHPVDLRDWSQWWRFEFGASWRRPNGRGRSNQGLDNHPVVHVAYRDAAAYAAWAGKELPTDFNHLTGMPGTRAASLPNAPKYLGLALIGCGVPALVVSIWHYQWMVGYLRGGPFAPIAGLGDEKRQTPVLAIAVLLILVGLFAFFAVLFRLA